MIVVLLLAWLEGDAKSCLPRTTDVVQNLGYAGASSRGPIKWAVARVVHTAIIAYFASISTVLSDPATNLQPATPLCSRLSLLQQRCFPKELLSTIPETVFFHY